MFSNDDKTKNIATPRICDVVWHDGQFIKWNDARVHVMSHVLHYGSSIFEGIRCYATKQGPAVFRLRGGAWSLLIPRDQYPLCRQFCWACVSRMTSVIFVWRFWIRTRGSVPDQRTSIAFFHDGEHLRQRLSLMYFPTCVRRSLSVGQPSWRDWIALSAQPIVVSRRSMLFAENRDRARRDLSKNF